MSAAPRQKLPRRFPVGAFKSVDAIVKHHEVGDELAADLRRIARAWSASVETRRISPGTTMPSSARKLLGKIDAHAYGLAAELLNLPADLKVRLGVELDGRGHHGKFDSLIDGLLALRDAAVRSATAQPATKPQSADNAALVALARDLRGLLAHHKVQFRATYNASKNRRSLAVDVLATLGRISFDAARKVAESTLSKKSR